jgi:2-hydroxy-6-oxonona-2,4-dienedioate hydrolase
MGLSEEGLMVVPGALSRWVRLASGVKAHYVTSGETGPTVVLLHGGITGSSGTAGWRFMAPFLGANGFRVYCPDMPLFGLTDDPAGAYAHGEAGHVDFLHDFITALCLDRFHLAGNSMGCINTVNYVVAHPERILSYALIAGSVGDLVPSAYLRSLDTRTASEKPRVGAFDGTEESMRALMQAIIFDPEKITDDLIAMRTIAANHNLAAFQAWRAGVNDQRGLGTATPDPNMAARMRTAGRLDTMTIPAIYLYGKQDVLYPVEAAYPQEDALPNVQFFYPDQTGHQGQTDRPELFNQVFLEFFRDGKISRATALAAGVSSRRPPLASVVETA